MDFVCLSVSLEDRILLVGMNGSVTAKLAQCIVHMGIYISL